MYFKYLWLFSNLHKSEYQSVQEADVCLVLLLDSDDYFDVLAPGPSSYTVALQTSFHQNCLSPQSLHSSSCSMLTPSRVQWWARGQGDQLFGHVDQAGHWDLIVTTMVNKVLRKVLPVNLSSKEISVLSAIIFTIPGSLSSPTVQELHKLIIQFWDPPCHLQIFSIKGKNLWNSLMICQDWSFMGLGEKLGWAESSHAGVAGKLGYVSALHTERGQSWMAGGMDFVRASYVLSCWGSSSCAGVPETQEDGDQVAETGNLRWWAQLCLTVAPGFSGLTLGGTGHNLVHKAFPQTGTLNPASYSPPSCTRSTWSPCLKISIMVLSKCCTLKQRYNMISHNLVLGISSWFLAQFIHKETMYSSSWQYLPSL